MRPAAPKHSLSVSDFATVGWMIFSRKAHPLIYDRLMEEAGPALVTPVKVHQYVSPQESVQLIAEGFGVAFAAKSVAEQIRGHNVVVRALSHESL
jgi:hypothetical protein